MIRRWLENENSIRILVDFLEPVRELGEAGQSVNFDQIWNLRRQVSGVGEMSGVDVTLMTRWIYSWAVAQGWDQGLNALRLTPAQRSLLPQLVQVFSFRGSDYERVLTGFSQSQLSRLILLLENVNRNDFLWQVIYEHRQFLAELVERSVSHTEFRDRFVDVLSQASIRLDPEVEFLLTHSLMRNFRTIRNRGFALPSREGFRRSTSNLLVDLSRRHLLQNLGHRQGTTSPRQSQTPVSPPAQRAERVARESLQGVGYAIIHQGVEVYSGLRIPNINVETQRARWTAIDSAADIVARHNGSGQWLIREVKGDFHERASALNQALRQLGTTARYLRARHGSDISVQLDLCSWPQPGGRLTMNVAGYSIRREDNVLLQNGQPVQIEGLTVRVSVLE